MEIGAKIRRLRILYGLTQEELADRVELSKGFISQLERDLASPSIASLCDILECLGTNLKEFFNDSPDEKIVYTPEDTFEKEDRERGLSIRWLIPQSQKNKMEPILVSLSSGAQTDMQDPHEGEEFGFVLSGTINVHCGTLKKKVKKGESFYIHPEYRHGLSNAGKTTATVLWIAQPPSF